MSAWDGSGDQYHSDIDPRYPLFSDIQTTDYSLSTSHRPIMPRNVKSYESEYLYSAQDMPAKLHCNCGSCPMREWPAGVPPMRSMRVEDREALAQMQYMALYGKDARLGQMLASGITPPACSCKETAVVGKSVQTNVPDMVILPGDIRMDVNTFVLFFIFVVFIFLCYCLKSLQEFKTALEFNKK